MIRIRQIKIDVKEYTYELLQEKTIKKLKINKNDIIDFKINKKSIDARDKNKINYIFEIDLKLKNENKIKQQKDIILIKEEANKEPTIGTKKLENRVVVVGSGPTGLFCAYILAKYNYKPLVIERGEPTKERIKTVNKFWETGQLNEESNVAFGEGGAGTFSDGKLNTLIKDKNNIMKKAFQIFVECGAPEEIMYIKNPHIGTDNLRKVIVNMRNKIIDMGGEFRFNTKLTDINIENNKLKNIVVNNKEKVECNNLVLAIGHSAKDTIKMLHDKGLKMSNKPFAVGLRIMHDQKTINENQYGTYASYLPPASYKLTHVTKNNHGVYSFCMCPGGYVVNSSSEKNKLVINGMSNYKRDSGTSNSAIVVTVNENDYGTKLFDGLKFQETLEQKAYKIGKGNIPTQTYLDFKNNKQSKTINQIPKTIKGKYQNANLREIFPDYVNEALIEGIDHFGTKIKGFNNDNTLLLGVESRTSSSIKIYRDETKQSNIKGIYPAGEGAGYSGGITSSALEGILLAYELINLYKPF